MDISHSVHPKEQYKPHVENQFTLTIGVQPILPNVTKKT